MKNDKSIKVDEFSLIRVKNLFLLFWFGFYIVYPSWLLPISVPARVILYIFFILYLSFNGFLLCKWTNNKFNDKLKFPSLKEIGLRIKNNSFLLGILLLAAALHIYPMILPITNNGDEGVHSLYPLLILRDFSKYTERALAIDAYSFVRIAIFFSLLGFVFKVWYSKKYGENVEKHAKGLRILGGAIIVILLVGYFYLLRNQEYQIGLFRFPPLGKISNLITYSLFGISEFTARLPSLVFSLLSGVAIYQLIQLYRSRFAATLGAAFLLFFPGYFFYSNLAYLEAGAIFFMILSSYYLLRHIKTASPRDFLFAVFAVGLGFMQRRILAVMFGVIWIYLILSKIRGRKTLDWSVYLKYSWIGLVPVIPWLVIGKLYVWRNYKFTPSHWLSYETATSYLRNMPGQITYSLFVIFAIGSLWGLVKKRDDLTIYSLILFIAYYIFFTSDRVIGYPRFMTALFPSAVIISVLILDDLIEKLGRKKVVYGPCIVILGYLILSSPINPVDNWSKYGIDYYFSYDEIFKQLQQDSSDKDKRLIYIKPLDSAVEFYLIKYGINYELLNVGVISTPNQLREYCRKHDFKYILFSYPNYVGDKRDRIYDLTEDLSKENGKMYKTLVKLERKQANQTIVMGKLNL